MYSNNSDKSGAPDLNQLPPLPAPVLPKGHADMSDSSNSESLIDNSVMDPFHTEADTAHGTGGDSSLSLVYGTGDGLKLPSKSGVVQDSSVPANERS